MAETTDTRGLHKKFTVRRNDGRDAPGEKHEGCEYFVLDLTHDEAARRALCAYALACRQTRPELSQDLMKKIDEEDYLGLNRYHSTYGDEWDGR